MLQSFVSSALQRWSCWDDQHKSLGHNAWQLWGLYVLRMVLQRYPTLPKSYWKIFVVVQRYFAGDVSLQTVRYEMYPYILECQSNKGAVVYEVILNCILIILEQDHIEERVQKTGMLCEKIFAPSDLIQIGRSILNEVMRV